MNAALFVGQSAANMRFPPRNENKYSKKFYVCSDVSHTHTSGRREGGREQGQPATTNNQPAARRLKQDSEGRGREGTRWVGRGGKSEEERKKERKTERSARTARMDPPEGVERAPSYTPVSKVALEEVGGGESEARTGESITSPYGCFSHVGTSPIGLLRHMFSYVSVLGLDCPPKHSELEVQTTSRCCQHPSLITGKCPAITFVHVQT